MRSRHPPYGLICVWKAREFTRCPHPHCRTADCDYAQEMAATLKSPVEMGEHASTSEVVREALRGWSFKRQVMLDRLTALRQDIDKGLAEYIRRV